MSKRSADQADAQQDGSSVPSSNASASKNRLFGNELNRRSQSEEFCSLGGQAVLVVSADGEIVEVLQAPSIAGGAAPAALIGGGIDELWPGDDPARLKNSMKRALRSRRVESAEFSTTRDDSYYDFIFIPHGRNRVMVVARDVSARKSAFSRMQRLAYQDDITKLPNRQFLVEELDRCADLLRLQEGRAAVLCIDVATAESGLHTLNATQQDRIFLEIASRLTHELRGVNQADIDDYQRYSVAARIGYRQFGILLPVIDSGADAEGVAQRLIESLQQPVKLEHKELRVRARIGIALFPQDGNEADALFRNALTAMEDARNSQAGSYKFHSGTVRLRALQRQDLELELRAALDKDEFAVEFLPMVDAKTRRIKAVEALLRWPQNVFGGKSIQKVISFAENTGLILPIGDWVLRKSCEALCEWRSAGWPDMRVAVNLSVQEYSREDLAERVMGILGEFGLDAECLDFEITEFCLFRDAMKDYKVSRTLSALGVSIVVDDYGTGACSLAHLARSPVAAIKIDNSFVANALIEESDRAACAAIAAMARQMNKRIIAEGVETEDQASMLIGQGCDALQGYLVSRPVSSAKIIELLQAQETGSAPADPIAGSES